MGSIKNALCPCGFKSIITVGGNMRSFLDYSSFPFYCDCCGLVDVNVAKEDLHCPKCKSINVKQYGIPPISEPPTINRGFVSCNNYKSDHCGHLCPSCKQKTMEFGSHGEIMFD